MPLSLIAKMEYHDRAVALRHLGFRSYSQYLNGPLWRRIRKRVVRRDRGRCVLCTGTGWQAHHLSYSQTVLLGRRMDQLQLLCKRCHNAVEGSRGEKRSPSEARREFFRRLRLRRKYTRHL